MTFSYDEDDDVLYVTFAQPKNGVRYVETDRGDVLRFCESTNQIVGVTIMFFADRTRRGEVIDVPEVGIVAFSAGMHTLIGHGKPHAKQA
jgi:uncharacterized protein YuzE